MLQNPRKTLGFKKNMVYKIPPGGGGGGGGKPYPASGLKCLSFETDLMPFTQNVIKKSMPTINA